MTNSISFQVFIYGSSHCVTLLYGVLIYRLYSCGHLIRSNLHQCKSHDQRIGEILNSCTLSCIGPCRLTSNLYLLAPKPVYLLSFPYRFVAGLLLQHQPLSLFQCLGAESMRQFP